MTYFNTTHLSDGDLADSIYKADTQEYKILLYFLNHPEVKLSPAEVLERVIPTAPITSARRALTNLTTDGYLRKAHQKLGPWGKPTYTWELN